LRVTEAATDKTGDQTEIDAIPRRQMETELAK